ncbi:MAG: hypothetical protein L3J96_00955, partial [Thermoplasmata archaeon]|nr:hypothetical protein [Thermoplasmata archaeon]
VGEGIEMTAEAQGIMVGFGLVTPEGGLDELSLWQFSGSAGSGFSQIFQLPAPASWTLQGSPNTPAYLLTPTYLIPITSGHLTAIPFNQLQVDGPGTGSLPHVVSLVPDGPGKVEIAATTSDSMGVDCWMVDLTLVQVTRTCHVSIGSPTLPAAGSLPIVALIDGGGWWIAIGASGDVCPETCINPPYNGVASPAVPVNGPASVGTSVCIAGCSSVNGLESYSFTPAHAAILPWLGTTALVLCLLGALWGGGILLGNRLRSRAPDAFGADAANRDRAETKAWDEKRYLQRTYLRGLTAWVLVWTPLAFLALLPSMSTAVPALPFAVVLGGVLGSILGFVYHHAIRARLAYSHGVTEGDLFGTPGAGPVGFAFDRVRRASYCAYASWIAAAVAILLLPVVLVERNSAPTGSVFDVGSSTFSMAPGSLLLLAVLVGFIGLRALYHIELASASNAEVDEVAARVRRPGQRMETFRTWAGSVLLSMNPLVGGLLALALAPSVSTSTYLLPLAFLPVTLLGTAVLAGCYGRTAWSPSSIPP